MVRIPPVNRHRVYALWPWLVGLLLLIPLLVQAQVWAQDPAEGLAELRTVYLSDVQVMSGRGVAYSVDRGVFYVLEPAEAGARVSVFTPYEEYLGQVELGIAVDSQWNLAYGLDRLWLRASDGQSLLGVALDDLAVVDVATVDVSGLASGQVAGMAVDETAGVIWLLDTDRQELVGVYVRGALAGQLAGRVALTGVEKSVAGVHRGPRGWVWSGLAREGTGVSEARPD
ncbi:hypothetical protein RY27_01375, partial [Litorilinea aerophila]